MLSLDCSYIWFCTYQPSDLLGRRPLSASVVIGWEHWVIDKLKSEVVFSFELSDSLSVSLSPNFGLSDR